MNKTKQQESKCPASITMPRAGSRIGARWLRRVALGSVVAGLLACTASGAHPKMTQAPVSAKVPVAVGLGASASLTDESSNETKANNPTAVGENPIVVNSQGATQVVLAPPRAASARPPEEPTKKASPKVTSIVVEAKTTTDDKEDARFEVVVKQGSATILQLTEGAGVAWDNGDVQEFNREVDSKLTGESIEVIAALQDGPWGWSNHWNAHVKVTVRTNDGRQLVFERDCAFRTAESRRRHEFNFGSKKFGPAPVH